MVSRGLLVAVVALAVLAGGVYWSEKAKVAEEAQPPKDAPPKLITFQDDQVKKVEIHKKGAEPLIFENDKTKWQITAPKPLPADQSEASAYLSSLKGLAWDRLVEEKAADLGGYGLTSPAVEVTLNTQDGKTQKVLIGDATPTGGAYFAKLGGDARVFTLLEAAKSSIDKSSNDLRDKRLLTFDSDKLARLETTVAGVTVELGRNAQKDWQIVKPKPFRADGFQVEELVRKLKEAKMDLTVTEEEAKKNATAFEHTQKAATVKVTDDKGTQTLEVHKNPVAKLYYAKSSAVPGIYKIATDAGEGLEKGLDDLRNKKLFDFGFNEPSKVELHDGSKSYVFTKTGDKWLSAGLQMDPTGFQMLVDKLRDLSAIKFIEKPMPASTIDASVTWGDGKRTDKVLIGKSGDSFLAKRENEPNVYELDANVVSELQKTAADIKPAPAAKPEAKK